MCFSRWSFDINGVQRIYKDCKKYAACQRNFKGFNHSTHTKRRQITRRITKFQSIPRPPRKPNCLTTSRYDGQALPTHQLIGWQAFYPLAYCKIGKGGNSFAAPSALRKQPCIPYTTWHFIMLLFQIRDKLLFFAEIQTVNHFLPQERTRESLLLGRRLNPFYIERTKDLVGVQDQSFWPQHFSFQF